MVINRKRPRDSGGNRLRYRVINSGSLGSVFKEGSSWRRVGPGSWYDTDVLPECLGTGLRVVDMQLRGVR